MYKLHSLQHPDWHRTGTSYCYCYIIEIIHHDIVLFFRKPTRPSLPLKKETFESLRLPLAKGSSTFLTKPLFPQEREDVTALRCSEPLRYKVGGPKRSTPCYAGWDRRKTEYLYNELTVKILISTYNILKYQNAILLNFRLVSIFLTYSLET